jgi:hypothetical protein
MSFDFENIVEVVNNALEKYKTLDNIELEGRIGIYDHETKKFETDIGEESYDIIKKMLMSCNEWASNSTDNSTTDFFHNKLRLSIDKNKNEVCVNKKKLETFTFITENSPFDFRITISKEDPIDCKKFPAKRTSLFSRKKERDTYIINDHWNENYNFDLTKVYQSIPGTDNVEVNFEYEIEFSSNLANTDTKRVVYSIILKLMDGMFACADDFIKTNDNHLPLENFSAVLLTE